MKEEWLFRERKARKKANYFMTGLVIGLPSAHPYFQGSGFRCGSNNIVSGLIAELSELIHRNAIVWNLYSDPKRRLNSMVPIKDILATIMLKNRDGFSLPSVGSLAAFAVVRHSGRALISHNNFPAWGFNSIGFISF
jgi:hypothetical protein